MLVTIHIDFWKVKILTETEISTLVQLLTILGYKQKEDTSIWKLVVEYKSENKTWNNTVTVDMDDLKTYTLNDATLNIISKKQSVENTMEFAIRNELMNPQENKEVIDDFVNEFVSHSGGICPTCQN